MFIMTLDPSWRQTLKLPPPGIEPGLPASKAGTLPKELSRQLIPMLRIRDVYPRSRILIFSHPGSWIQNSNKREVLSQEFFYSKLLAAGSQNQLPAPLERNLADAWNIVTAQNNRNEVVLLHYDVYFYSQCDSQIHITTVARSQFAGSGEPATKANNTILLAI